MKIYEITEAFDNPYDVDLKNEYGDYEDEITLDDGSKLRFRFEDTGGKEYEVMFTRNEGPYSSLYSYDASGQGDQQRVMATVLHAVKQFITRVKPMAVFFSAEKSGVDDKSQLGSREKLYTRMATKMADPLGYKADVKHARAGTTIWLRRVR